ncbi:hypothetical protein [Streptomyces sp. NPDC002671]
MQPEEAGVLTVNGPSAVWTCPCGHEARRGLSAPHIRNALTVIGIDPLSQGSVELDQELYVVADGYPEDAHPRQLFVVFGTA